MMVETAELGPCLDYTNQLWTLLFVTRPFLTHYHSLDHSPTPFDFCPFRPRLDACPSLELHQESPIKLSNVVQTRLRIYAFVVCFPTV
jgi:hypothetical protein